MTKATLDLINYFAIKENLSLFGKYEDGVVAEALGITTVDVQIMVFYGFVDVEYQNVEGQTGLYRTFLIFNQRWRNLRRFKSLQALTDWEKEMEQKNEEKINLENKLLKSQVNFQEVNNTYIAEQEKLITSQIATNENVKTSNESLKSIFRWTLIVAGIGLIISAVNTYESFHKDTLPQQLKVSDSLLRVKNFENAQLKKALDSFQHKP